MATCERILFAMFAYGPALRQIREKQEVSMREIARLLEISPTYISDIERGLRNPFDPPTTRQICEYLKVDDKVTTHLLELAAEDRIRHSLVQTFPSLSDVSINRMVKVAVREFVAGE